MILRCERCGKLSEGGKQRKYCNTCASQNRSSKERDTKVSLARAASYQVMSESRGEIATHGRMTKEEQETYRKKVESYRRRKRSQS